MRGGIVIGDVAIPSSPYDRATTNDHGPHRHFSCLECSLGAAQCLFHPKFVGTRFIFCWLVSREQFSSPVARQRPWHRELRAAKRGTPFFEYFFLYFASTRF